MTMRKIPARSIIVQVESATPGTWLTIAGKVSAKINPGENEETADPADFESAGNAEEMIMQRGIKMELEGWLVKDHLTDAQDPGQARCEDLAAAVAYECYGAVRFRHPAATTWKMWPTATFRLGEQGGNTTELTTWSCTITRSGASTTAAV